MDFREVIENNRRKTKIVLGIYFLIYAFIGLLLDVVVANMEGDLSTALVDLVTFNRIPFATLGMFGFAILTVIISIKGFKRIQLSGNEYVEIEADNTEYKDLYNIVEEMKISANLNYMPNIYIIEADYMNAFASGWSEDNTLIAVTRGLYDRLTRQELTAVVAHELTHIRNEDIKLTLIVGVATNIMLFVVQWVVFMFGGRDNGKAAGNARMILMVMYFVLPILTMVLQLWMSRSREYMADAGSVELTRDPDSMANALKKISVDYNENEYEDDDNATRKAAYIFENKDSMFSTHPDVESRLDKILRREQS